MKTRNILTMAMLVVASGAFAQMNQIAPGGNGALVSTANFGVDQIFGDFADFSGAVIDDFTVATTSNVTSVAGAFELSTPTINLGNIKGWQVSIFSSVANAGNSGNGLNNNTEAQQMVATATNTELFGTLANGRAFRFDVKTNLNVNAGSHYLMVAPVLDFTNNGQTFLLSNTDAGAFPGGNNSFGINPGNGFGGGTSLAVGTNAALELHADAVPEPASMVALGLGIAAFARRRRSSK